MSNIQDTTTTAIPSNVIEARGHEDPTANQPQEGMDAPAEKPGTVRDAIAKAFDEQQKAKEGEKPAEEGKEPEKAKAEPDKNAENQPEEKAAEAKKQGEKPADDREKPDLKAERDPSREEADRRRREEGKPFYEPPQKFLPKAKEAWANVPNVVKGEIDRISREHENQLTQYRESHEEMQKLSKFTEMAKQHNTSIGDALERYTAIDGLLHNNPIEGIRQVLATIGVTPQQYAKFISENPDAAQAPRQPPQPDPYIQKTSQEVEQLRAKIEAMEQEQAAREFIEPFKRDHPRFDELQDDIAFFLNSGKIPQSLSPIQRLETAYDMAERINPVSRSADIELEAEAPARKPVVDPRGEKSIRGGPTAGFDPASNGRIKNRRDAISAAMTQFGA